jgi:hypothetical protein
MITLIRVARVVVLLLAAIAVSMVVAVARPETGAVEKVALAALVAGCFTLGVAVNRGATSLSERIARR